MGNIKRFYVIVLPPRTGDNQEDLNRKPMALEVEGYSIGTGVSCYHSTEKSSQPSWIAIDEATGLSIARGMTRADAKQKIQALDVVARYEQVKASPLYKKKVEEFERLVEAERYIVLALQGVAQ